MNYQELSPSSRDQQPLLTELRRSLGRRAARIAHNSRLQADIRTGNALISGPLLFRRHEDSPQTLEMHFVGDRQDAPQLLGSLTNMQQQLAARPDLAETTLRGVTHRDLAIPAARLLGTDAELHRLGQVSDRLHKGIIGMANAARAERGQPLLSDDSPLYQLSLSVGDFIDRDFSSYLDSISQPTEADLSRRAIGEFASKQMAIAYGTVAALASMIAMSDVDKSGASHDKTTTEADKYNNNTRREATRGYSRSTGKF